MKNKYIQIPTVVLLIIAVVVMTFVNAFSTKQNKIELEAKYEVEKQVLADSLNELEATVIELNSKIQSFAEERVGGFNFVGGKNYFLYGSGVGSSDTSLKLTSFKMPVAEINLTMTNFGDIGYGTIDPGSATKQEFISFTGITQNADGTATLTGVTRGLLFVSPYTASSTLQKAHTGGAIFVISNPPQLYNELATKKNDESITGTWNYPSTSPPRYDFVPPNHSTGSSVASTSEFASVAYVNATGAGSNVSASESVRGEVELATQAEMASSTPTGGTGASLALYTVYATSSPYTTGMYIPITEPNGKISSVFINLNSSYTWTGPQTFSGPVVFNTIPTGGNVIVASSTPQTITWDWRGTAVDDWQGGESVCPVGSGFNATAIAGNKLRISKDGASTDNKCAESISLDISSTTPAFSMNPVFSVTASSTPPSSAASISCYFVLGSVGTGGTGADISTSTRKHMGFQLRWSAAMGNGEVHLVNGDGSAQTSTKISGWNIRNDLTMTAVQRGSAAIDFFINGTKVGTHTTNLPTGAFSTTDVVQFFLDAEATTAETYACNVGKGSVNLGR